MSKTNALSPVHQVVAWLLTVTTHLPSEELCQKYLVAPIEDKDRHDELMLGRTKCYDLVTKVGLTDKTNLHCSPFAAIPKNATRNGPPKAGAQPKGMSLLAHCQ